MTGDIPTGKKGAACGNCGTGATCTSNYCDCSTDYAGVVAGDCCKYGRHYEWISTDYTIYALQKKPKKKPKELWTVHMSVVHYIFLI